MRNVVLVDLIISLIAVTVITLAFYKGFIPFGGWKIWKIGHLKEQTVRAIGKAVVVLLWIVLVGPFIINAHHIINNRFPTFTGTAIYTSDTKRTGSKIRIVDTNNRKLTVWVKNDVSVGDEITVEYLPFYDKGIVLESRSGEDGDD